MFTLNAQSYAFVRGTFNAAGSFRQNVDYSSRSAVGEDVQGTVTGNFVDCFLGFFIPVSG
ncbi:MAG: hypothetical protein H8E57_01775 [Candidatus Cloacimonetes bacterium]|nr:hypothetical protein [Candidatus Cloacimonadota bacterium]